MSLAPIVRAIGGDLYDRDQRAVVPGPGHSARDRSVSLLISDGRLVVHSFGRSSWREVLDALRDRGLIGADGRVASGSGRGWTSKAALGPSQRTGAARKLWSEIEPLTRQLSLAHVRRRGILRAAPVSAALGHHSAVPTAVYAGRGSPRPALLAKITSPSGELTAVEVTYLQAGGLRAGDLRVARKVIGVLPPSSAVRLDEADDELVVGEGVFTALSASGRFDLPAWALLSARNLRSWSPPPEVRRVLIAADRDVEGERSARLLRRRLNGRGVAARIAWPPPPAGDWNEAEKGRGEGREG